MTDSVGEALAVIGEVSKELERTILFGWPFETYPTDPEAHAIEYIYNELSLQEPRLPESRRWFLAGQIVARLCRDLGLVQSGCNIGTHGGSDLRRSGDS